MKNAALAVFSLWAYVVAGNAHAADPFAGAYLGANVGYGTGKSHPTDSELNNKPSGKFGGIQAGYNWANRDIRYGLAVDLDAARMEDTILCPNTTSNCKTEIKAFGNLRGNVGQIVGKYFAYGTAGMSTARLRISVDDNAAETTKRTGWTAGLGLARSINDRLWWQLQYLHIDLGSKNQTLQGLTFKSKVTTDTVALGVNFTF